MAYGTIEQTITLNTATSNVFTFPGLGTITQVALKVSDVTATSSVSKYATHTADVTAGVLTSNQHTRKAANALRTYSNIPLSWQSPNGTECAVSGAPTIASSQMTAIVRTTGTAADTVIVATARGT